MAIFDRWGNEVYSTEDFNGRWDGKIRLEMCCLRSLFSKDRFNRTSREEEDHIWQGSIDPMIREEPNPLYVILLE